MAIICIAIGFGIHSVTTGSRAIADENLDAPLPGSRGHFALSSYATQNEAYDMGDMLKAFIEEEMIKNLSDKNFESMKSLCKTFGKEDCPFVKHSKLIHEAGDFKEYTEKLASQSKGEKKD